MDEQIEDTSDDQTVDTSKYTDAVRQVVFTDALRKRFMDKYGRTPEDSSLVDDVDYMIEKALEYAENPTSGEHTNQETLGYFQGACADYIKHAYGINRDDQLALKVGNTVLGAVYAIDGKTPPVLRLEKGMVP